ncbi:MAG: hypothetical protein WCG26_13230, partial [Chloroflexales bacterium]
MSEINPCHQIVAQLAAAISAGTLADGNPAQVWASVERHLATDRLASATLLLFASDPASADMQRRIAQALDAHLSADELARLSTLLRGGDVTVRTRITAAEDALIERSGHKVLAPPGPVDLATHAGPRGRIIDSPITVIGAGASAPSAPMPASPPEA